MQLRLLQIWQKGRLRQMNFWHFFWKNIRSCSILVTITNGERILIHKQVVHYLNLFNYRMSIVLFFFYIELVMKYQVLGSSISEDTPWVFSTPDTV